MPPVHSASTASLATMPVDVAPEEVSAHTSAREFKPRRPPPRQEDGALANVVYAVRRLSQIVLTTVVFLAVASWRWFWGFVSGREHAARQFVLGRQLTDYFQGLGGTFVKLGQFLAARSDFIPVVYCQALSQLLDDVKPFPTRVAIAILNDELGDDAARFISGLDEPIAAASFGQVYRTVAIDGRVIALKIQRPEARRHTRVDLFVLSRMASLVDMSLVLKSLDLGGMVGAFRKWTEEELDYLHEARSASTMRRHQQQAQERSNEYYPDVYWEFTTSRVLALEFVEGVWLSDLVRPGGKANLRLRQMSEASRLNIARSIFRAFLNQVFVDGFFHGDPHPGNILIMEDEVVSMVDFGIVGTMSTSLKDHMGRVLRYASINDTRRTFHAAAEMLQIPSDVNIRQLQAEYEANLEEWYAATNDPHALRSERSFARLLLKNIETVRKYGVTLPNNVFRYYRSFITLDPLLQEISGSFNINAELKQFFTEMYRKDMLSDFSLEKYVSAALQYQRMLLRLPGRMEVVFDSFDQLPQQVVAFERRIRLFAASFVATLSRLVWLGVIYGLFHSSLVNVYPAASQWPGAATVAGQLPVLIGAALAGGWLSRRLRFRGRGV